MSLRLLYPLWILSILLVMIGSLLPASSPAIRAIGMLPVSAKGLHFCAYTWLALLALLAIKRRPVAVLAALASLGLHLLCPPPTAAKCLRRTEDRLETCVLLEYCAGAFCPFETDYALFPPAHRPAVSARRIGVNVVLLDLPAARIPWWPAAAGTRLHFPAAHHARICMGT